MCEKLLTRTLNCKSVKFNYVDLAITLFLTFNYQIICKTWHAQSLKLWNIVICINVCRCGKLLRDADAVQFHAAKTQHSSFSESTDEVKPLTKEEKEAQMAR